MLFANEIVSTKELEKYTNEHHKQVVTMIENKAGNQNQEFVAAPADTSSYFADLMPALETSMATIKKNETKKN
jgi:DNA end-binding protein Ku